MKFIFGIILSFLCATLSYAMHSNNERSLYIYLISGIASGWVSNDQFLIEIPASFYPENGNGYQVHEEDKYTLVSEYIASVTKSVIHTGNYNLPTTTVFLYSWLPFKMAKSRDSDSAFISKQLFF